ncbi:N-acetylglucosamine kinase [Streptomyces sp. MBT62]|uniref:N-acetylglucosamine kinase n=1 Tax=Streptomyces sp. MBT62 TaxID=2800410 RepID=UPI0019097335|nr:BadF/BadG/BcrA/BcrD ATPase family protein [Streptomyces sp. MBT62]MBK3567155.1 ATPase [Streptomyces sp. MBT62]
MSNDLNQEFIGDLVVGLDAGGTRTRAVLATAEDGRPLGEGAAGPGNALTVPVPRITEHLVEAIAQAVPEAARARVVAVAGGFAGATAASTEEPGHVNARTALTAALRRLDIPADRIRVCSDIEAAFASAPGTPADGLALVAGTGAVALRITDRRSTATVDGDGWLLGDDGSGFWIGRSAVRAALRMADGRGPTTILAGSVGQALGVPAEALPGADWSRDHREAYRMHVLPAVMAELPIRLARFAPLVVEAAEDKDTVAEGILDEAADQLTDTVRALNPTRGERIVATGGLLGPEGPLTAPLTARLHTLGLTLDWVPDGCRGAIALARLAHDGDDR